MTMTWLISVRRFFGFSDNQLKKKDQRPTPSTANDSNAYWRAEVVSEIGDLATSSCNLVDAQCGASDASGIASFDSGGASCGGFDGGGGGAGGGD